MSGRIFVKSSYSTHEPISRDCVEASAPEGFRFKGAVQYCGNAACQEVAIPTELTFGKSWYTNTNGACFEVGGFESQIYLRDSKLEDSPLIDVMPDTFSKFVAGVVSQESFVLVEA